MRDGIGNRGLVKVIFVIAVFVALAFVGLSFGRPYYRFIALRSQTIDTLEMDIGNAQAIREKVLADAASLHVPLNEEDLEVTRDEKRARVRAKWSEVVDFWGYYRKQLDFSIDEVY
jgi:hypothetical protein